MKATRNKNREAAGGTPPAEVKASTIGDIQLVIQQAAIKLARNLTADEATEIYAQSAKLNHPVTVDEAVAIVQSIAKNAPEFSSAGREPRTSGISANESQAEKKRVANETVKNLYLKDIEEWNKHAADLKTNLGAQIGTFAAMRDDVEQVRKDHSALKDAIKKGTVPADTRIMPAVEWTAKDGSTQHGFLDFQDYCRVALGRTKQAVYAMLGGDQSKQPPKKPDDSVEAVTKRGGVVLNNLFSQALAKDDTLKFDQFVERLKKVATEYAKEETAKASKVETKKAAKLSALRAIADSAA
jgi:hypothetical protein